MTPEAARRYVLGMIIFGAVLVAIARLRQESSTPRIRLVVGAVVVLIVLSALSEVAPRLAAAMAGLVFTSSLFTAAPALSGLIPNN